MPINVAMTIRDVRLARWSPVILAAVAVSAAVVLAQRDQPGQSLGVGTASIAGTVVDATTGRALIRARVTLSQQGKGRVTLTDGEGRFQFPQIPAGSYELSAALEPYMPTKYGQKRTGRPGTTLNVQDRQQLKDIAIPMMRGGVVAGTVIDPAGQPIVRATIRAMKWRYGPQGPMLEQTDSATTDDRGEYRIFGLEAGDYVVLGEPRSESLAPRAGTPDTVQPAVAGIAPSFHPGTPLATQATTVTVAPGEIRSGVDIVMPVLPLARINGTVVGPNGQMLNAGSVEMVTEGGVSLSSAQRPRAYVIDGRFTFSGVAPGAYDFLVISTTSPSGPAAPKPGTILYGVAHVAVAGSDINDLVIPLQFGVRVSGRVRLTGTGRQASLASFRMSLAEVGAAPPMAGPLGPNATVDASGAFSFAEVPPGRFRFFFLGGGGWSLQSATLEGEDVLRMPLTVGTQDVSDIVMTFTDTPVEITGTATTASAQPMTDGTVIVFPVDRRLWTNGVTNVRTAQPDSGGRFRVSSLSPGEYFVAAMDDVEQFRWFDPRFLEQLASRAERLSLAAGEKRALNLQEVHIR